MNRPLYAGLIITTASAISLLLSAGFATSRGDRGHEGSDHGGQGGQGGQGGGQSDSERGRDRGDCFGINCNFQGWYTQSLQPLPVPLPRPRPSVAPKAALAPKAAQQTHPVAPTVDRLARILALSREIQVTAHASIQALR